jgi:hypothetical protein
MNNTLHKAIRKAIVTTCMKNGVDKFDDILIATTHAVRGIGYMSAAAYKAHATMRKQNIRRRLGR